MPDILVDPWACRAAYLRLQKEKQQARLTGLPRSPTRSLSREGSLASSLGTPGARLPATAGKTGSSLMLIWLGVAILPLLGISLGDRAQLAGERDDLTGSLAKACAVLALTWSHARTL